MSDEFSARAFRDGPAALLGCDEQGVVMIASTAAERLLGADPTGRTVTSLVDPDDRAALSSFLAGLAPPEAATHGHDGVVVRVGGRDGQFRVLVEGTLVPDGDTARPVLALSPVAEVGPAAAPAPGVDALTGLPSREALLGRLRGTLAAGGPASVAIAALDGFKLVNDVLGDEAGDAVLRVVAATLTDGLPPGTAIGRLGGDEFGCVFPGRGDEEAAELLRGCMDAVRAATAGLIGDLAVTFSAGVAATAGGSAHAVLRRADDARLQAKAQGRARVVVNGPASQTWVRDRLQTAEVVAALQERARQMMDEARTDALTGLPNMRALKEAFARLDEGRRAADRPYAMLFVDADRFGLFNHVQGSAAGDAALRLIAQVLDRHARASDRAFRKGGEEFLVLLHGADLAAGLAVAERVRADVEALGVVHGGAADTPVLTVTVGVALATPGVPASGVCDLAGDRAYAAKDARRRNTVAGP